MQLQGLPGWELNPTLLTSTEKLLTRVGILTRTKIVKFSLHVLPEDDSDSEIELKHSSLYYTIDILAYMRYLQNRPCPTRFMHSITHTPRKNCAFDFKGS